jgi:hypothetical protein
MSGFQQKSGGIVAKRKTKGTASAVPFIRGLDSGQARLEACSKVKPRMNATLTSHREAAW